MKTLEEVKKEFKPIIPKWLFKIFFLGEYKTKYSEYYYPGFIFVMTLIAIISYELNDKSPTWFVYLYTTVMGFLVFLIILLVVLTFFHNLKIQQICKKYGFTIEEWNEE